MFQSPCGGVLLNVSVCVMEFSDNVSVSVWWIYLVMFQSPCGGFIL